MIRASVASRTALLCFRKDPRTLLMSIMVRRAALLNWATKFVSLRGRPRERNVPRRVFSTAGPLQKASASEACRGNVHVSGLTSDVLKLLVHSHLLCL